MSSIREGSTRSERSTEGSVAGRGGTRADGGGLGRRDQAAPRGAWREARRAPGRGGGQGAPGRPVSHVFPRVQRPLPTAVSAEGAWVTDADGRRYLDGAGGAIVVGVGHGD